MDNNLEVMLTTIDNPFDPFQDYDSWLAFDLEKGYQTCERLARLCNFSEEMTQKEMDEEANRAMDRLIAIDILDLYKKIYRNPASTQ